MAAEKAACQERPGSRLPGPEARPAEARGREVAPEGHLRRGCVCGAPRPPQRSAIWRFFFARIQRIVFDSDFFSVSSFARGMGLVGFGRYRDVGAQSLYAKELGLYESSKDG